jgi:hypothetical protein
VNDPCSLSVQRWVESLPDRIELLVALIPGVDVDGLQAGGSSIVLAKVADGSEEVVVA